MRAVLEVLSAWAIPVLLAGIPAVALARGVKVYPAFVEGAKQGFEMRSGSSRRSSRSSSRSGCSVRPARWTRRPARSRP
jgi:hypothetical protein